MGCCRYSAYLGPVRVDPGQEPMSMSFNAPLLLTPPSLKHRFPRFQILKSAPKTIFLKGLARLFSIRDLLHFVRVDGVRLVHL